MAGKKLTKKQKKALIQWLCAVLSGILVMLALACWLKPEMPEPPEPIPGIDVSSHQGVIDWQAVADSGVEFAMIRLGYRSYRDGVLYEDEQARCNLEGARAAGLEIGAYFFSQALTPKEAEEEAAFAMEILEDTELDLPLAYDWEQVAGSTRTAGMDAQTLTACVLAFCGALEGCQPMVYFNLDLSRTLLDADELSAYPFWFAQYADAPELGKPIRMWQYSDEGVVPGITEKTDLNWYYPFHP